MKFSHGDTILVPGYGYDNGKGFVMLCNDNYVPDKKKYPNFPKELIGIGFYTVSHLKSFGLGSLLYLYESSDKWIYPMITRILLIEKDIKNNEQ